MNYFVDLLQYVLIVFIGLQKALRVTKSDHRNVKNYKVHYLFTDFTQVQNIKNFENMLVEILVTGFTEIHGTSIKLCEVDLLVLL